MTMCALGYLAGFFTLVLALCLGVVLATPNDIEEE